jgi:hypothetical protein
VRDSAAVRVVQAAVCSSASSARGSVWQCTMVQQCSWWRMAMRTAVCGCPAVRQCAAVCGSVRQCVCSSTAVCSSAAVMCGRVRGCVRLCAAVV